MIVLFLFVAAHPTLAKLTTTIFAFFYIGAIFGLLGMGAFLASFHWIVGATGFASVVIAMILFCFTLGDQKAVEPGGAEVSEIKPEA